MRHFIAATTCWKTGWYTGLGYRIWHSFAVTTCWNVCECWKTTHWKVCLLWRTGSICNSGLQNMTFHYNNNALEGLCVLEDNALEGLSAWRTGSIYSSGLQHVTFHYNNNALEGLCVLEDNTAEGLSALEGSSIYTVLCYRMWHSIAATTCLKVCLCWGTGWWYLEKTTRTRPRQENSSSLWRRSSWFLSITVGTTNPKQNEAQSARAESTQKVVN